MEYWKIQSGGGYQLYWFLEIVAFCAVDGFAIIFGYTSTGKQPMHEKIAVMWFQAVFYSFVCTLILGVTACKEALNIVEVIKSILPFTFNYFWYFTAYVGLLLTAPMLNKFLFDLELTKARNWFIGVILLFCCLYLLRDPLNVNGGYSTWWLKVLYCIGVLAKRCEVFKEKSNIQLLMLLLLSTGFTWIIKVFLGRENLVSYISPTIVLNVLILIVLFSRINLKGTLISKLSPLVFDIYNEKNEGNIYIKYSCR